MHMDIDPFYAQGYLNCWCNNVRKEWAEFLDRAFTCIVPEILGDTKDPWVLDVGSGPSIANVISARYKHSTYTNGVNVSYLFLLQ